MMSIKSFLSMHAWKFCMHTAHVCSFLIYAIHLNVQNVTDLNLLQDTA